MAGDWIPMRTDLFDSSEVVRLVSETCPNVSEDFPIYVQEKLKVIGALHRTWSLFDSQTDDGVLIGYSEKLLDSYVGIPGWTAGMRRIGWLSKTTEGIVMEGFTRWLSSSAKARIKDAQRKRVERKQLSQSCPKTVQNKQDEKRTTEQNRTEQNNTNTYSSEVGHTDSKPVATVGTPFETIGNTKQWLMPKELFDTIAAAYPDIDLPAEFKKAKAWLKSHPEKRKTARGMPKFLNGWVERSQNNGNGKSPNGKPIKETSRTMEEIIADDERREKEQEQA